MTRKRTAWIAMASTLMSMVIANAAMAQFGDLAVKAIKVLGIGYAVKTFGGQINSFINTALQQHDIKDVGTTKVVPIIRVGSGVNVGAAQVVGLPEQVRQVQGVGEGELGYDRAQLRYLIPVNSLNLLKGIPSRASGVGVSAIIDFRI